MRTPIVGGHAALRTGFLLQVEVREGERRDECDDEESDLEAIRDDAYEFVDDLRAD